jgi:hypothetical protein
MLSAAGLGRALASSVTVGQDYAAGPQSAVAVGLGVAVGQDRDMQPDWVMLPHCDTLSLPSWATPSFRAGKYEYRRICLIILVCTCESLVVFID